MRKNPHDRILKGEPKEQHLSIVPMSCLESIWVWFGFQFEFCFIWILSRSHRCGIWGVNMGKEKKKKNSLMERIFK